VSIFENVYYDVFIFTLCLQICFLHPFYLGMSSKAMLSVIPQALSSNFPIVLHMDCTFKCNNNKFPILVLGISDACQQFHPLSISIISHRTEQMYEDLLTNFNRLVLHVLTGVKFPNYAMTDCEPADR
jgi:hypothetical protein